MTLILVLAYQPQHPGSQGPGKHEARYCPVPRVPCTQLLLAGSPSPRGSEQPHASGGGLALQSSSLAEGAPGQRNPSLRSSGAGLACTAQSRIAPGQKKNSALWSLSSALKPACVPSAFPA